MINPAWLWPRESHWSMGGNREYSLIFFPLPLLQPLLSAAFFQLFVSNLLNTNMHAQRPAPGLQRWTRGNPHHQGALAGREAALIQKHLIHCLPWDSIPPCQCPHLCALLSLAKCYVTICIPQPLAQSHILTYNFQLHLVLLTGPAYNFWSVNFSVSLVSHSNYPGLFSCQL